MLKLNKLSSSGKKNKLSLLEFERKQSVFFSLASLILYSIIIVLIYYFTDLIVYTDMSIQIHIDVSNKVLKRATYNLVVA